MIIPTLDEVLKAAEQLSHHDRAIVIARLAQTFLNDEPTPLPTNDLRQLKEAEVNGSLKPEATTKPLQQAQRNPLIDVIRVIQETQIEKDGPVPDLGTAEKARPVRRRRSKQGGQSGDTEA